MEDIGIEKLRQGWCTNSISHFYKKSRGKVDLFYLLLWDMEHGIFLKSGQVRCTSTIP
jgi:hypothetical protein